MLLSSCFGHSCLPGLLEFGACLLFGAWCLEFPSIRLLPKALGLLQRLSFLSLPDYPQN